MDKIYPSVLHISQADNIGGSARSAYKIHSGIRALGLQSRMLVKVKVTNDPDVDHIHDGRRSLQILDLIGQQVVDRSGFQYLYYPSSFALTHHPWFQASDIIQLYNIHGGFFTHRVLPQLSRERPVVWRLSDMWPLTGHCAYSYDCERWKTGCGSCPLLSEYPALNRDTTALLWRVKERVYKRSQLVVVTTNTWMDSVVQESPLLRRFPVYRIPNGVDTKIFQPISKTNAREVLGIAPASKVVLFIAHIAKMGTRKGGEYIARVMESSAASRIENLVLVVAGEGADSWPDHSAYQIVRLGFTNVDRLLSIIYSAADVMVHPALVENFPNSILEGMACATPAVAFNTGGVADVVRHMETGYLAGYKDSEDLARGVRRLLEDSDLRSQMSGRCRAVVEAEYSNELQAQRFADLYRTLIAQRRK